MFAGGTFAQSPFAALGNKTEPTSILEAATASNTQSAQTAVLAAMSESATATDLQTAVSSLLAAIAEQATASENVATR